MADPTVAGPPPTRREELIETIHGLDVSDPYRWLEDGEADEVVDWVLAQNQFTRQALDARPSRDAWLERLSALVAMSTVQAVAVRGDRSFVLERAAGANQFALVGRSGHASRTLLDPAALAADAAVAIDWFEPDPHGNFVAVGLSEGGTEDSVLHILDVSTGALGELSIAHTRAASVAWAPDGSGFWYTRYPEGDQYHRHVRWHSLDPDPVGTQADEAFEDIIVFDRLPTPEAWPDVSVSPDGCHVLVHVAVGWARTDVHLLDTLTGNWHVVVEGLDGQSSFEFGDGCLIGRTTVGAPNGRVVAVPFDAPGPQQWSTVVPERDGVVLGAFAVLRDQVVVAAARAAVDTLEHWSFAGGDAGRCVRRVEEMGPVAVAQLSADPESGRVAAVVSSFDSPTSLWTLDLTGDGWTRECSAAPPPLSVQHLSYPSLDGTEIGLFVMHRPDVSPGPDVPLILNGYGGFAIAETPQWLPNLAAWCGAGGVWAIAGLRGGYEHGERWHHAGRRERKQNVFDDFHSAADWLVASGRASRDRLALVGGSNGGLLVGAALTQRPDLARAVWCAVPLLDMVRFPQFLIARLWTDEYGDPDVPEEFGWLYAYSPYHAVERATQYPAVLFTTAEGDTRVDPLHARKMAALLQDTAPNQGERPVLLWQATRSGHGVGKPAGMRIAEGADVLSFLSWQLGSEEQMRAAHCEVTG